MAKMNKCTKNRSKRKPRSQPLFSGCGNGPGQKQCATIEAKKIVEVPEK